MENIEPAQALHLTTAELEAGLDYIRQSPKDEGTLKAIVVRPAVDQRVVLPDCEMSAEQGVHGDNWLHKGRPDIDGQVLLINARAIDLLARTPDRWALAGDQLYVDLDLSEDNLQAGQRLALGSAILGSHEQAASAAAPSSRNDLARKRWSSSIHRKAGSCICAAFAREWCSRVRRKWAIGL